MCFSNVYLMMFYPRAICDLNFFDVVKKHRSSDNFLIDVCFYFRQPAFKAGFSVNDAEAEKRPTAKI